MKSIIILSMLIAISLLSCNTFKGYKIIGDGKNCFSIKEKKAIIDANTKEKTKYMGLRPLITINKDCVGLYGIIFSNLNISTSVVDKVLKFEDRFYQFDLNSPENNKENFKQFEKSYESQFTKEEFEKLKSSFFKGTEIEGRLY